MPGCFGMSVDGTHDEGALVNLKLYISILLVMTIYYIIISLHKIQFIKDIYPPFFEFVEQYNGCIQNGSGVTATRSVSVWYIIYLIIYITIFSGIIIYILTHLESNRMVFKTLGDGIYVFIIMMIFLFVIVNRILFYNHCFDNLPDSKKNKCVNIECESGQLWEFKSGSCVSDKPGPEPDNDSNKNDSNKNSSNKNSSNKNSSKKGLTGPPGPPGAPGPPATISSWTYLPAVLKKPGNSDNSDSIDKDLLAKDLEMVSTVKDDLKKVTESFALYDKKTTPEITLINKVMNNLETYIMTMVK